MLGTWAAPPTQCCIFSASAGCHRRETRRRRPPSYRVLLHNDNYNRSASAFLMWEYAHANVFAACMELQLPGTLQRRRLKALRAFPLALPPRPAGASTLCRCCSRWWMAPLWTMQ